MDEMYWSNFFLFNQRGARYIMNRMSAILLLALSNFSWATETGNDSSGIISEWDIGGLEDQFVITSTRIGQSISDTPGSVTVLSRTDLLNRGITTIPEALRLVPGMSVLHGTGFGQNSGNDYQISYHGGAARVSRRLQVQVDGMSVYLGGLSKIDWSNFPVTVHDIERIEVTRNPSAATYGANSFSAVVNVITQHSRDLAKNESTLEVGSRDDHFALYRFSGGKGNTTLSLRASQEQNDGYDFGESTRVEDDLFPGHRDSMVVNRFNLRLDSQLSGKSRLSANLGVVEGDYETEYVVASQDPTVKPDINISDYYLNVQFSRIHSNDAETRIRAYTKQSTLEQDFRACAQLVYVLPESFEMIRANPAYFNAILAGQIPSGGSTEDDQLALALLQRAGSLGAQVQAPVCGTLNQDYVDERHHLTIEHHRVVGDSLRIVGGGTVELLSNESQTYFDGKVEQYVYSLFFNAEYEPISKVTLNAGIFVEETDNNDQVNVNPRLSVNWHFTKETTLRLVGTQAYRSPDLAETDRDWAYYVKDIRPIIDGVNESYFAGYASSADFDLQPEKITAYEIGLYMKSSKLPFTLDTRLFYEELDDLISGKPAFSNFNLSNNASGINQGFEIATTYDFSHSISANLSYSYQDHDFDTDQEEGLNTRHQGQTALVYENTNRAITAAYVGNSTMSQYSFDQWTLSWVEKLKFGKALVDVRAIVAYSPSTYSYNESDIGLMNTYRYDNDTYGKLSLSVSF